MIGVASSDFCSLDSASSVSSFLFVNIQCLSNKILDLELTVGKEAYQALCISEHWQTCDSLNSVYIDGYFLANSFCRSTFKNGGVAIFVSVKYQDKVKPIDVSGYCVEKHHEFCCVQYLSPNVILICAYRSPAGDVKAFFTSLEGLVLSLQKERLNNYLILGGDVNIDVTKNCDISTQFINLLKSLNLYCTVWESTRLDSCLDNVATDLSSHQYQTSLKSYALGDHLAVSFDITDSDLQLKYLESAPNRPTKVIRPIKSTNLDYFVFAFSNIDWDFLLFSCDGAEECFNKFFGKFIDCYNCCFPAKTIYLSNKPKEKFPDWTNQSLIVLKRWVLLTYDLYCTSRTPESRKRYISVKNEYKAMLTQAKMEANVTKIESSANQCAAAWKIIKRDGGLGKVSPSILVSPEDFNEFFVDSVLKTRDDIPKPAVSALELLERAPAGDSSFSMKPVSCDDVMKAIRRMKNSSSKDVFDISPSFLKLVADCVVKPLTYCINFCLMQGVFPKNLKLAKVVPVHKKDGWDRPENFRPVSILPVFSKVFESLIKSQLSNYFEANGLLSAMQCGFRPGLSTMDALEQVLCEVYDSFQDGGFAGVTLCDLSKAFDLVDHQTLLSKLAFYGIKDTSLELLKSYLSGREQTVSVNGRCSEYKQVSQGVPQGSILGPLLFIVMVNDMVHSVPGKLVCYADDTTIVSSSEGICDLKAQMESSLSEVSKWFSANFFKLNESKTQTLIFSLNQVRNDVNNVKLLGLYLDSKLDWNCHINYVCGRLSRVIYLLRNLRDCVPKNWLRVAYCAFFQSVILYGLSLWGSASGVGSVLLLQKKALRIVSGSTFDAHCKPIFKSERLLTVYSLFVFQLVMGKRRELDTLGLRSSIHSYNTRSKDLLNVPFVRLKKCQMSSRILSLNLFNRIPHSAWYLPEPNFKLRLLHLLTENPLYSLDEFFELSKHSINKFF